MNDNSPEQDAPPPVTPTPASNPFPTAAPYVGAVALGQGKLGEADEKMMGLLAHILGAVTSFIGPLIIWQIKKDESPFVADQGKEALNFQITIAIGYFAMLVLSFIPFVGCLASIVMLLLGVASLVFSIIGGLEANKGKVYRYPFALRLIS